MSPSDAPLPRAPENAPAFAEPWQAELFGLTLALQEAGVIAPADWAAAFGTELTGGADDAGDYFDRWLAALERLLAARGLAEAAELAALAEAWQRAAHATPHGRPILLENDPLSARAGPAAG